MSAVLLMGFTRPRGGIEVVDNWIYNDRFLIFSQVKMEYLCSNLLIHYDLLIDYYDLIYYDYYLSSSLFFNFLLHEEENIFL